MSNKIRCKMVCHSVEAHEYTDEANPLSKVRFGAVYSNNPSDEESYVYGKYTPYGDFSATFSKAAADRLEVGRAYYIDIVIDE